MTVPNDYHQHHSQSYIPKNILVTGGAGFIGSHLSNHLCQLYKEYKIIVIDKLDYCSSLKNLQSIWGENNFKFYEGNILNRTLLDHIFKSERIDTVIHLAAYTHVDHSFEDSILFTENNIMGTHYLLECSKKHNVKRFIYASTDEVYGTDNHSNNIGSIENKSVLKPTNPYSASKAGAELLVQSYHSSFSFPSIITRGNNVYGPYQYPEKIIPKFIKLLSNHKPCTIHGDGSNIRSFLFIKDVVNAFDLILHRGVTGQIYNIGTDFEITNLQVAQKLIEMFNLNNENNPDNQQHNVYIEFIKDRPFNDTRYLLNTSKLKELGWVQTVDWENGLQQTLQWYLNNLNYWDKEEQQDVKDNTKEHSNNSNNNVNNSSNTNDNTTTEYCIDKIKINNSNNNTLNHIVIGQTID